MFLFLLLNNVLLASFVWLMLSGAGLALWTGWIVTWFAADCAVIWLTGYESPNWAWGAVLAVLAALWALLTSGMVGV